jgi:hypothetical protein
MPVIYKSLDETLKELEDIKNEVSSRLSDPFRIWSTRDFILLDILEARIPNIQSSLRAHYEAAARNDDARPLSTLNSDELFDRVDEIDGKAAAPRPR